MIKQIINGNTVVSLNTVEKERVFGGWWGDCYLELDHVITKIVRVVDSTHCFYECKNYIGVVERCTGWTFKPNESSNDGNDVSRIL